MHLYLDDFSASHHHALVRVHFNTWLGTFVADSSVPTDAHLEMSLQIDASTLQAIGSEAPEADV